MTRKSLMLTAAITGIAMLTAAAGAQIEWDGSENTLFNNGDNWVGGSVPGAADDVVFPTGILNNECTFNVTVTVNSVVIRLGRTCTVSGITLTVDDGSFNVLSGGLLDITGTDGKVRLEAEDALDIDDGGLSPGKFQLNGTRTELELAAASTTTGHDIDGELLLMNATAFIDVQESMWFIGDGKVEGSNASAAITIASGKTLSNKMSAAIGDGFRGFMTINGSGTFNNEGRVEADGGILHINPGAVDDLDSGDLWIAASANNSELKFSTAATALQGDFILSKKLQAAANVQTCGGLTYNIGASISINGNTFKYQDFDGGTCTAGNPADSGTGADCTTNIFVVSSNKTACTS